MQLHHQRLWVRYVVFTWWWNLSKLNFSDEGYSQGGDNLGREVVLQESGGCTQWCWASFGILQARWNIIKCTCCQHIIKNMWNIMKARAIMHNMIVDYGRELVWRTRLLNRGDTGDTNTNSKCIWRISMLHGKEESNGGMCHHQSFVVRLVENIWHLFSHEIRKENLGNLE